ncbi:MAG TPA: LytTR family DNA-binding domain-containing protein [Candidatus Limiplasma sp.]|nr:LytTR family DNA-binding domain-containing protein [Candidatus Limiplasma sp.]HRX09908.1 LytTR family DNA-binding domain-containing protein [Candidatus Limiplasma sp.]
MTKEPFQVLIADDDDAMRSVLKHVIDKAEGFVLAGEACNGEDTMQKFEELKPHVVFLDVEMPEMDGVECARQIQDTNPATVIIFVTAHNRYMSEAFEVYAFDYLVKPFKVDRMLQTLARVKDSLTLSSAAPAFSKAVNADRKPLDGRLMLKHREGSAFVDLNDLLLVQREDRSTVLYTKSGERYAISESLSDIEGRLPSDVFFRSHKSYIINLNHIKDITPYGRWTYVVRMDGIKQDALITHAKYEELENMFR